MSAEVTYADSEVVLTVRVPLAVPEGARPRPVAGVRQLAGPDRRLP